jgi:hypothetical protein
MARTSTAEPVRKCQFSSRQRIRRDVHGLGVGGVLAGLGRVDAERDQGVVLSRDHPGLGERVVEIGTHDAAQIGTAEIAECQDGGLTAQQIGDPYLASGRVAEAFPGQQPRTRPLLIGEVAQVGLHRRLRGQRP